MNIEYLDPKELVPYSKNAKRHPAEQVRLIANSIKQFGFRQPIVVDKDNVVVIGHGRLLASKRLHLAQIPVTRVDDLTDEQIRVLRLADNSVAGSDWNIDLLSDEIADLDLEMDINLEDFGLLSLLPEEEEQSDDNSAEQEPEQEIDTRPASTQHNVFENQERMQFPILNYYGIPELAPTQTTGQKFCRFMDYLEIDDPSKYICHFYYDDFKFMSAWREPDKYVERLKKFKAVICPDFSSYTDFPIVLQILGAYRRNWCGAFWQALGMDVIPDVQWGDNEETYKWCFEGIPENATVAISSLGVSGKAEWNGEEGDWFKKGFDEMINRLHPSTILWYGNPIEGCDGNIIRIPSYYEQKRDILNKQKAVSNHGKRGK